MSKGDARLTGPQVTTDSTVKRRLRDDNLFGSRPSRKSFISKKNRMA